MAPSSSFASVRPSPSASVPWLYGPARDLLIGCGAWSLPLLVVTFWLERVSAVNLAFAFYLLGVFCNNPHYMATIYRAYRTAADFRKYRFFTVYVTAFLLLTVVLAHFVPALAPWIITLYLTWSPWHYTGQNYGIAQMFVRRAGAAPDNAARSLLYGSYAASYAVWALTLHSTRDGDPNFLSWQIPERIAVPLQFTGGLFFLVLAGAAFVRLKRRLPGAALLPPLLLTFTQFCWFVAPALLTRFTTLQLSASYFSAGALAFMHCAQYLWITAFYARKEQAAGEPRPAFFYGRYYLVLVVGGIALFVPGPWLASRFLHQDITASFLIFMSLVNLHHFILDGAIWKLRDGRIARLLLGRNPPGTTRAEAETAAAGGWSHVRWLFGRTPAARVTRYGSAVLLLVIGFLDQAQFFFTRRGADPALLAWARVFNPHDTRINFRRAQLDVAEGKLAAARRELEHIIALNPRNAPAQHLLGEVLFRSGDTAAALVHYDRMAEIFRSDLAVTVNRGVLSGQQGRPAQAVARFEEALAQAPHRTGLHYMLARALDGNGEPEKALRQYGLFATLFEENTDPPGERARNLPDYLRTGLVLGDRLAGRKDLPAAQARFQRTAEVAIKAQLFDFAAEAINRLAGVEDGLGQHAEADKNRALARRLAAFAKAATAPPGR